MQRIIIIGNSGSGKTHLALKLSDHFGYPLIQLDRLFWEPGGFKIQRPKEMVCAEISHLCQNKNWIVEGVFGELAKEFIPNADFLVWLDLDWETCSQSLHRRGSESSKQLDPTSAEENFQKLLKWTEEYWQRDGLRSHQGHKLLFEQFSTGKTRLDSRKAADDFADSILGN
jgi:adenylate kinase family enzyme